MHPEQSPLFTTTDISYDLMVAEQAAEQVLTAKPSKYGSHFRRKPKRLPSYIKLEKQEDDSNSSEDTHSSVTSTISADDIESPSDIKPKKAPKTIMVTCLRKVAKQVCGGQQTLPD